MPARSFVRISSRVGAFGAGRVVGDIGDGAIHRPDHTYEGGRKPLDTILRSPSTVPICDTTGRELVAVIPEGHPGRMYVHSCDGGVRGVAHAPALMRAWQATRGLLK